MRKYLCLCFERPVRMELRPFELAVGLSLWPNPEICRPLPVARVWQIRTPVTKKLKNSLVQRLRHGLATPGESHESTAMQASINFAELKRFTKSGHFFYVKLMVLLVVHLGTDSSES